MTPISRFLDLDGLLKAMGELAEKMQGIKFQAFARAQVFHSLRRYYREEEAPEGLSFFKFLQVLDGLRDKEIG